MKKRMLVLTILALTNTTSAVYASNTPASQQWVSQQLANLPSSTLSAADWAGACTSGTPESVNGCLGNISSSGFIRINKILGGFTDQINIPITNVPNSLFIQQYNGSSSHVSGADTPTIHNLSSAGASCSYFTTQGANLSATGVRYQNSDTFGGGVEYFSPGTSGIVLNTDGGSTIKVTYYVLCIGSVSPASSTPQAGNLTGISAS